MQQPKVTKRERKLFLSYDLPHRIHCAAIYPITAQNGSTVLLYGHERGLRILWRGGRRRREHSRSSTSSGYANGLQNGVSASAEEEHPVDEADFEDESEEMDPDCSYPSIIQDIDIEAGAEVIQIAVPSATELLAIPRLSEATALVAIATTDGAVSVLRIPLLPPATERRDAVVEKIARSQAVIAQGGQVASGVALKVLARNLEQDDTHGTVLVAFTTRVLNVASCAWSRQGLATSGTQTQQIAFAAPSRSVSFNPSARSTHLLVVDSTASVRIYEPAPSGNSTEPTGVDGLSAQPPATRTERGRWITSLSAPFPSTAQAAQASIRRKQILDAKYASSGKRILVLLEDGEWGLWDLQPPLQDGKSFGEFVLRGFLTSSVTADAADQLPKSRKGLSKLAPTTPNTRKAKAESLFSGTPKVPGAANRGGISVSPTFSRSGPTDESIMVWYNADVFSIPSMQAFCQRSFSNEGGVGSLYAPVLSQITDVNLQNENITSLSQFSREISSASVGQMNIQRDFLVTAEHRALISQTLKPPTPARSLFQRAAAEPAQSRDQHMLDAGELDLGGMDRMLDSMAGRPRRVGFAE